MSVNNNEETLSELDKSERKYVRLAASRHPGTPAEIDAAGKKNTEALREQQKSNGKQSSAPWRKKK